MESFTMRCGSGVVVALALSGCSGRILSASPDDAAAPAATDASVASLADASALDAASVDAWPDASSDAGVDAAVDASGVISCEAPIDCDAATCSCGCPTCTLADTKARLAATCGTPRCDSLASYSYASCDGGYTAVVVGFGVDSSEMYLYGPDGKLVAALFPATGSCDVGPPELAVPNCGPWEQHECPPPSDAGPSGPPPTWTALWGTYLATSTIGKCPTCHSQMATAPDAYTWLVGQGQIGKTPMPLADPNTSCLSWFGGNMPPSGPLNAKAVTDFQAWADAGGLNN